ncbi:uncharacterized protein N7446_003920 [Penicillium canescens]|uniref:Uncharacterized protein n=1 Tax=Penicillium canescens TaxID=5083 RepID=A0AAD6I2A6_PENCN|nr:uncharacterized protein N7446_003920 [Penicillium canescens]KAJ6027488.1 hypothetical protein N7460_012305 [Penicillium canescens]KAJ6040763.1 hypothetical protein N7444_009668 [Penicillium canescens]KAJ6066883.1 hypothetical protein N7446_003920 [Penicillium canescens]
MARQGNQIAESLAVWGSISRPVHPTDHAGTDKLRNTVRRYITASLRLGSESSPPREACLCTLVFCVTSGITRSKFYDRSMPQESTSEREPVFKLVANAQFD